MIPNGQPIRPASNSSANPPPAAPDPVRLIMSPPAHLVPILDALMQGQTDAAASRRLNMSPRTFSRRVAELLDYLGVETRFQGGVKIALSGWVPRANGAATEARRELVTVRGRTACIITSHSS